MNRVLKYRVILTVLCVGLATLPAHAQVVIDDASGDGIATPGATPENISPNTLVIDDFEHGVTRWTRNDKTKTDNPAMGVVLVDVATTSADGGRLPGSKSAGLFTFKDAKNSWASASIPVSGANWARIGAQKLTFWLDADGSQSGTELVLRARVKTATGEHDEAFYIPIRLNVRQWRRVAIPLSDIKNAGGPLLGRLSSVYLLQFVQRGTWDSRFFSVDELQVEGNGTPLQVPVYKTDPPTSIPVATPANPNAIAISADFLKPLGRIRTSANVSIGVSAQGPSGSGTDPLAESDAFRRALSTLRPRFVRLDAAGMVDMVDSMRPTFDYSRLASAVRTARALNAEPVIALSNDATWGLDERSYAVFCAGAARAVNIGLQKPVRYFELPTGAASVDDASAVSFYNRGRAALKAVSPNFRVGGIGASSGRTGTLSTLLARAQGLDFLSLQFYGAVTGQPPASALFNNASALTTMRAAAAALDKSKWSRAPIFVTGNLSGATGDTPQLPSDARNVQMVSAAWWSGFLTTSSRLADQVFHNDAVNPEWGLLNEDARAYPAYYSLWMWNTFFPPGSERVQSSSAGSDVVAFAANTPTAHNLLLSNTTDRNVAVRIGIRGFPVLRAARVRILDDPQKGVSFQDLPKSPFQNLTLKPYAVAVLQFVEPPKAKISISTR